MSCLRTLNEGSSHDVVRLFSLREGLLVGGSCTWVRLLLVLAARLGVLLDVFEACEVACSGALLTSSDSVDSFRGLKFQALVIC